METEYDGINTCIRQLPPQGGVLHVWQRAAVQGISDHERCAHRIPEYTENGMSHIASRRCDMVQVSKHGALLSILTNYRIPTEFYLELPDARIGRIGCKLLRNNANNTIEVRFLRGLTEKEMNRIFVHSTHPDHRNVALDIRA